MDKTTNISQTEALILDAARKVFLKKGMEGARMQEIADEAGINKSLLHYYFGSKEKLFENVFKKALKEIFDTINASIHEEQDVYSFIAVFVEKYMHIIRENAFIPNFIFNEINRNPERIRELAGLIQLDKGAFGLMLERNILEKKMARVAPEHLLIDLVGMSIFPIIARPLVQNYLFDEDENRYQQFLDQRSKHIVSFFKIALAPSSKNKTYE